MAGVEQAETVTRSGRRAARRRASQHAAVPDTGTDAVSDPTDRPKVSLAKKARPAHAHADEPAKSPGTDLVLARPPRPGGPAHSGAPLYRPRHAKRRRSRWPVLLVAGLVLVALVGVGAAALIGQNNEGDGTSAPTARNVAPAPANLPTQPSDVASVASPEAAAPGTAVGTAECRYTTAPDKSPRFVPPTRATRSGLVTATINTNRGPVTLELDATNAPCTVQSFLTLAAGGYFNDTACHRLTTQLIFVLQCGDPTALGSGDPGYSFDDENLPAPGGTPYPRGTLAMANAGPGTNGSQFFMVYKDSPIDPNYPVFGKVTGGLEIVEQVAAGGAPGDDGQPNVPIVIQAVQIS
jgi:peptidyl-prolyl cis-trans isomerase B (cyclophilin B)